MSIGIPLALAFGASTSVTAALVPLLRRAGVIDVPVERSLHANPIVRGGGMAVIAALSISWLTGLHLTGAFPPNPTAMVLVLTICAFAVLGFVDDVLGLGPKLRLGVQLTLGLACGFLVTALSDRSAIWAALVLTVLVVAVNITNFMDGVNGLVSGHAVIAGLWFAGVAWHFGSPVLVTLAAALAGAAAGFLPFNALRPRVFLGDAGSYGIGAALALLAVALLARGAPMPVLVAPLAVYLLDTAYTLQLRVRARHRWYEPHKLHIYQRLVAAGWSHLRVATLVTALTAAMCLLTLPTLVAWPMLAQAISLGIGVATALVYLRLPVWSGAPEPWRPGRRR